MTDGMLERAADALGPLTPEVVFVGGATVGVWITDPAAPEPRPTLDVDVVSRSPRAVASPSSRSDSGSEGSTRTRTALLDGRAETLDDGRRAPDDVREYCVAELRDLLGDGRFIDGIYGALRGAAASQARAETVVLPGVRAIVEA